MWIKMLILAIVAVFAASGFVLATPADPSKGDGPEVIQNLDRNGNGKTMQKDFKHRAHQKYAADLNPEEKCKTCHFEESAEEKANPMKLAQKACIQCHKAVKEAGKPSGPTSCKDGCHEMYKKDK